MVYHERASRALIEENRSVLKQTWVTIQDQRDSKIIEQVQAKYKIKKEEEKDAVKRNEEPPKNRDIMAQRKGFDRPNREVYGHLKIGGQFKFLKHQSYGEDSKSKQFGGNVDLTGSSSS